MQGKTRNATCEAIDHVELVQISKEDFLALIEESEAVRQQLLQVVSEREEMNVRQDRSLEAAPLQQYLAQGLLQAQNLLVIDLEKCVRCDDCVNACASAHDGITRLVREGLRFDKYLVATSCRQCLDPMCMIGCPVGSIRRKDSMEIIIEDWCIGCGLCAEQCPYGNINLHEFSVTRPNAETGRTETVEQQKAVVCDLCTEHKEPSCVYACPHGAAKRIKPMELFAEAAAAKEAE